MTLTYFLLKEKLPHKTPETAFAFWCGHLDGTGSQQQLPSIPLVALPYPGPWGRGWQVSTVSTRAKSSSVGLVRVLVSGKVDKSGGVLVSCGNFWLSTKKLKTTENLTAHSSGKQIPKSSSQQGYTSLGSREESVPCLLQLLCACPLTVNTPWLWPHLSPLCPHIALSSFLGISLISMPVIICRAHLDNSEKAFPPDL